MELYGIFLTHTESIVFTVDNLPMPFKNVVQIVSLPHRSVFFVSENLFPSFYRPQFAISAKGGLNDQIDDNKSPIISIVTIFM